MKLQFLPGKTVSIRIVLIFTLIFNGNFLPLYADDNGNDFLIIPLINADYGDGGKIIQHPRPLLPSPCQDQDQNQGKEPRVLQVSQQTRPAYQGFPNTEKMIKKAGAPEGFRGKILERGSDDNPYTVIDHYDFFLKFGIAVVFTLVPGAGVGAGIAVDGGRNYLSKRNIEAQEDAHKLALNLPYLKRPEKSADLDAWNEGDYLRYQNRLGLSLLTFAGAGFLAYAGVRGRVGGEWDVKIKKAGPQLVKVTLNNAVKLTGKLMAGIFPVLNDTAGKGFKNGNGISITFDLNQHAAREALDEFLDKKNSGIRKAQKLAGRHEGVTISGEMKGHKVSGELKYKLRMPFVASYEKSRRKIRSKRQTSDYLESSKSTIHTTSIITEKKTKRPKRHKKYRRKHAHYANTLRFRAAQGLHIQKTDENGIEIPGNGNIAEFIISFANDTAKVKAAGKAMEKLKKATALDQELDIWFPDEKELGYVGIEFKMAFTRGFIQTLKDQITLDPEFLTRAGERTLEGYFSETGTRRICGSGKQSPSGLAGCRRSMEKSMSHRIQKISRKIGEVDFSSLSGTESSDYMAELIQKVTSHPLVLRTFLSLEIPEIRASFRVEGEKFLPYQNDLVRM